MPSRFWLIAACSLALVCTAPASPSTSTGSTDRFPRTVTIYGAHDNPKGSMATKSAVTSSGVVRSAASAVRATLPAQIRDVVLPTTATQSVRSSQEAK